ncbi:MAG TPA: hypothetical protein VI197_27690 [Polyangiaceae bacterium]
MKPVAVPATGLDAELRTRAEGVGLQWAQRWFDRAEREQRALVGGWPGTMSEARAHVVRALVPWLRECGRWPAADVTNFEATARVVYSSARAAWRQRSVADSVFPHALNRES